MLCQDHNEGTNSSKDKFFQLYFLNVVVLFSLRFVFDKNLY